jgi:phage regulator Rha-like protein
MLNEQQAALLISLMRNNDEVVAFKVRLLSEFYRMRDA